MLAATPLFAHPHVWADIRVELTVDSGHVDGFWVDILFDDIYSHMVLMDIAPGTTSLDDKARSAIGQGYFRDLRFFDYFGHLTLGDKPIKVPSPEKFSASVDAQHRLAYLFYLPLRLDLSPAQTLKVSFYDDSYYFDLEWANSIPLLFHATGKGKGTAKLLPFPDKAFYGGVIPSFAVFSWGG